VPGPGNYELGSKAFGNPRFAMGVKLKDGTRDQNPGPGTYSGAQQVNLKGAPSYT